MRRFSTYLLGFLLLSASAADAGSLRRGKAAQKHYDLREGDIVFQGNAGPQSDAVRAATDSRYTHCGVVFQHDGQWMVMEAIQPVQATPLQDFIDRSLPGTFYAMRLKNAPNGDALERSKTWARQQAGLPYDLKFQWGNEALYCSEFVWKLYQQADIRLCNTRAFRNYDLDAPVVKKIIQERYGGPQNLPLVEPVVAPSDLAASNLLAEVPVLQQRKKH